MKKSINRCPSCGGRCLVETNFYRGDMLNTTHMQSIARSAELEVQRLKTASSTAIRTSANRKQLTFGMR